MLFIQGIKVLVIILFFLNLSINPHFLSKGYTAGRGSRIIEILIITILSFMLMRLSDRIDKKYFIKLNDYFYRAKEGHFLVGLFITAFLLNSLVAYFVFDAAPTLMDDLSYVTQGKIFASGKLFAPAPISAGQFCSLSDITTADGKWYSRFSPGFPLILALGMMFKIPLWLINPFFGALSLLLVYFLGKELYDKKIAVCACLLGLFSPLFLLYSNLMPQTTLLFFSLLFIIFFVKMLKSDWWVYPLLAGLSLGVSFIIKQYSALFMSLPSFAYLSYLLVKRNNYLFKKSCLLGVGFMIFLLFFLWYNRALTGNAFVLPFNMPFSADFGNLNSYDYPGFHKIPAIADPGFMYGLGSDGMFSLKEGLLNVNNNFVLLNLLLFGWPLSLIFFFVYCIFMKKNKWDILLMALFFSIVIGYLFYWWCDVRYWHITIPALLLLTARAIRRSSLSLKKLSILSGRGGRFIPIFIILCFMYSLLFWYPTTLRTARRAYFYGKKRIITRVKNSNIHNAIIFVRLNIRFDPTRYLTPHCDALTSKIGERFYACNFALTQNSITLNDDILYALDFGVHNIKVTQHYPQRKYFVYEYNFQNQVDKFYEMSGGKRYDVPQSKNQFKN